jgi:FkbM family methyltransferase
MNFLAARGVLDVVVDYPLGKFTFGVPLRRNPMDLSDVLQYEAAMIASFCSRLPGAKDVVLFDCGADIGIFSSTVCARSEAISRIIAFEPNPDAFPHLQKNMGHLPVPAEAIGSAVANFAGSGKLVFPDYAHDYQACFLVPGDGQIKVTTIDSFSCFGRNIAIKIDVEGGELDVLRGASETIRSATACVIALEAHPLVARRIGRDPVECLRFLESLREFDFCVSETGASVSTEGPFIQPGQTKVFNIICVARADKRAA